MQGDPEIGQLDYCTWLTTDFRNRQGKVHIIYTDGVHGDCQDFDCPIRHRFPKPCNGHVETSGPSITTPIPDIPYRRT